MPLTSTIAELMLEKGRAQAAGQLGAANAYASALQNIGQNVGQAIASIPQQQEAEKERQDKQHVRDARTALAKAMQDTPMIDLGNGAKGHDIQAIGQKMIDGGFGPEFSAATDYLDKSNQSWFNLQQSRLAAVHTGAVGLQAAGDDPGLYQQWSTLARANHAYPADMIDSWDQKVKDDPSYVGKITSYVLGPPKLVSGAPGSVMRREDTGQVVPGSQVPFAPGTGQHVINGQLVGVEGQPIGAQVPVQVNPVEQQRAAEAARHNLVMEGISKMTAGREAATLAETIRHNRATELAANPFAAMGGQVPSVSPTAGTQPQTSVQPTDLHGDDFLKTLPPAIATEIKAYADGRLPFPSGFAVSKLQPLIQAVSQYDPSFDATNYNARNKARTDLTSPSGTGGKTINALNTAISHAGRLSDLIEALGNNDIPAANYVANLWNKEIGGTKVTNFEAVQPQLMKEIERAWRGTGGSQTDIDNLRSSLGPNAGIQQQRQALQQFVELMKGKLSTTETQRDNALGPSASQVPVLFDQSKPILDKIEQRASGGGGASSTGGKTLSTDQIKQMASMTGKTYAEAKAYAESQGYVIR